MRWLLQSAERERICRATGIQAEKEAEEDDSEDKEGANQSRFTSSESVWNFLSFFGSSSVDVGFELSKTAEPFSFTPGLRRL